MVVDVENDEFCEIETIDELCKKLCKSRRDPEFTPVDYLNEIISRLTKLITSQIDQDHQSSVVIEQCWTVCHALESAWPWMLSNQAKNQSTRFKALELILLISGVPT
jgi:hypothetical protein